MRVHATKGKITVQGRSKSRGKHFWFDLALDLSNWGFELPGVNCRSCQISSFFTFLKCSLYNQEQCTNLKFYLFIIYFSSFLQILYNFTANNECNTELTKDWKKLLINIGGCNLVNTVFFNQSLLGEVIKRFPVDLKQRCLYYSNLVWLG